MRHPYRKISVFFVVFLFLFAPNIVVALPSDGIVISPGYDAVLADPDDDVVKISFWELSPSTMILFAVFSVSPVLVFPVELFLALKIIVMLGIRRLTKNRVLDQESRMAIYDTIQKKPGMSISQISLVADINRGTAKYHLTVLEKTGKITHMSLHGNSLFFENNGTFSDLEKTIVQNLKSESKVKILEYLLESRIASRPELATALDVSGPAISWHMHHLRDDQVVLEVREGREVKYRLDPHAVPHLQKYFSEDF
jgi:predicted transcriptional regulator